MPETPPRRRQLVSLDAPQEHAADGEHVCRHEGEERDGDDDVEGGVGAEGDEAEQEGYQG